MPTCTCDAVSSQGKYWLRLWIKYLPARVCASLAMHSAARASIGSDCESYTNLHECAPVLRCNQQPWQVLVQTVNHITTCTGPRSAVGNVSGYRYMSDCRSRGHEFDPGPVPYFRGDWSWNNFYGHSPPFRWFIQEGLLSVTSESMCTNYWLTACSSLPRKKVWLGELTVPQWP